MKTLLILRHAKSSWTEPELDDHDRPLNDRGRRDAPRMGRLIQRQNLIPDTVLTSTANRARRTAELAIEAWGQPTALTPIENLYLAAPGVYLIWLGQLDSQEDPTDRVMVVGHNPGVEELVTLLSGARERMPTAALARIDLPIDSWPEVVSGVEGTLVDLWRPKELKD